MRKIQTAAKRALQLAACALVGGAGFWGADAGFKAVWGVAAPPEPWGAVGIIGLTLAEVGVTALAYRLCRTRLGGRALAVAAAMLGGIWLLGPVGMFVLGAMASGRAPDWGWLEQWVSWPLLTGMGATYDGSLGALMILTIGFVVKIMATLMTIARRMMRK